MVLLAAAVTAMGAFHPELESALAAEQAAIHLLAKVPTAAAFAYRRSRGLPYAYPRRSLDYSSRFLADDLLDPRRGLRGRPGGGPGARRAAAPARRPRAELLHLDGPPGGQQPGQRVRLGGLGHQRPLRAPARRGQPGSPRAAADTSTPTAATTPSTWPGPRTATTPSACPASAIASTAATTPGPASSRASPTSWSAGAPPRTRCSTSPWRSSRRRSPTTTSSSATCTPTWTSTPGSCSGPWASPPGCSRCSSPSAAFPAGSPSGRRWPRTPILASAAPARCTSARPGRDYRSIHERELTGPDCGRRAA